MDPSQEGRLSLLLNSLVESSNVAKVQFSQGSITECLRSIQETRKNAEHAEFMLRHPEQERVYSDLRSGTRIESLPQDYLRHGQASIQDKMRGPFQYPAQPSSHRHPNTQPQYQRGSPSSSGHILSPGHASFPGSGAALGTHPGQPQQRYPQDPAQYRDPIDSPTFPHQQGSHQRPFHVDQGMNLSEDESTSPKDHHRSLHFQRSQRRVADVVMSEGGSSGSGSGFNSSFQSSGQISSHRGSTGAMQDPGHLIHRKRQNSLPHVLEHHPHSNTPYIDPIHATHLEGPRPISPGAASQQNPHRTQYMYDTYPGDYPIEPDQHLRHKQQQQQQQQQHHHHHHQQQHQQHYSQQQQQQHDFIQQLRADRHNDQSFQQSRMPQHPQYQPLIEPQQHVAGHKSKLSVPLNSEEAQKNLSAMSSGVAVKSGTSGINVENKIAVGGMKGGGGGQPLTPLTPLTPAASQPLPTATTTTTTTSSSSSSSSSSHHLPAIRPAVHRSNSGTLGNLHPSSMSSLVLSSPTSAGAAGSLGLPFSPSTPSPFGGDREKERGSQRSNRNEGGGSVSRTQFHAPLEPEVIARLDELFFKFLQGLCSDLNACDSKGDQIHQPLMAKKMQRLEASTDFRPFKFRIQAFTNAFHESLVRHGLTEDILPLRKVKVYLWKHKFISRFNEDGKKQKSKGNHVWNIEARKLPDPSSTNTTTTTTTITTSSSSSTPTPSRGGGEEEEGGGGGAGSSSSTGTITTGFEGIPGSQNNPLIRWEFREYTSRIAGQIIKFARVGVPYIYAPRIWDAQMSCPKANYSSPWLPPWLKWHKGELRGTPGPDDKSCTITVVAEYDREGENCHLELVIPLTVSDPEKEGELMDLPNDEEEDRDELEDDDGDDDRAGGGGGGGGETSDDEDDEDDAEYHYQDSGDTTRGRGRSRKQGRERQGIARAKERQESKRRKQTR